MNEQTPETDTTAPLQTETSAERFSKTSSAAKISGKINVTAGFFKQKIGEMIDNTEMEEEGRNQRILGKIHSLVGEIREIRELTRTQMLLFKNDSTKIIRNHSGRLIDQASDFLNDVRKVFWR